MKKILIIILSALLLFYLFWNYIPLLSVQASYEEILAKAIERNYTPQKRDKEVIFVWANYAPQQISGSNNNSAQQDSLSNLSDTQRSKSSNTIQNIQARMPNKTSENLGNSGNFGNPNISGSRVEYNDDCAGIFFDPCIVVSGLNSEAGKWHLIESGTPIYNSSKEITSSYQK